MVSLPGKAGEPVLPQPGVVYTPAQAAPMVGLTEQALRRKAHRRQVPYHRTACAPLPWGGFSTKYLRRVHRNSGIGWWLCAWRSDGSCLPCSRFW